VPPEGEEQRPDHQIIISYAGPEAQDKFDRRSLSAEDVRWDYEKVLNLTSRLGVDDETRDAAVVRHESLSNSIGQASSALPKPC
jgi:hypothetical protein